MSLEINLFTLTIIIMILSIFVAIIIGWEKVGIHSKVSLFSISAIIGYILIYFSLFLFNISIFPNLLVHVPSTTTSMPTTTSISIPPESKMYPLEEAKSYGWEDAKSTTDIMNWEVMPQPSDMGCTLAVNENEKFSHSSQRSLVLVIPKMESGGWVSVGIKNLNLKYVKEIVAWVSIPGSEQGGFYDIMSNLVANPGNVNYYFTSENKRLEPDVWTPFFLGVYDHIHYEDQDSQLTPTTCIIWDGSVNDIYINMFSNTNYAGNVYIDDVTVYTYATKR